MNRNLVAMLEDPAPSPDFFIGRQQQLQWFERIVFSREHWFRPIMVSGPFGSGKTALIHKFLHSHQDRIRSLWISGSQMIETSFDELIDHEMRAISDADDRRRVVVVIDDATLVSEESLRLAIRRILNWKIVQTVIVSTANNVAIDQAPVLTLAPLNLREIEGFFHQLIGGTLPEDIHDEVIIRTNGSIRMIHFFARTLNEGGVEAVKEFLKQPLYNLDEVTSSSEIIEVAKPKIIYVTDELIAALKKEPESIYTVSPRKFEELLAQLLESIGMKVELTQASKDGGCDILARLNLEAGRFLCVIEAKRYAPQNKVGVEIVKQLYATFAQRKATSAMLITTSSFTKGAKDFQKDFEYNLSLKEYTDVVRWIQNYKPDNQTGLFLPD